MDNDRRQLLTSAIAIGTTAAAAGAGLAWWRRSSPARGEMLPPGGVDDPAVATLWTLDLQRPDGSALAMRSLQGKPLVVNFWATWCPPCVREMPALDRFHQAFGPKGWQVVGLAIDGPTPVREFLARTPVRFPIGLAGLDGTALVRSLGNPSGGLPFTVVLGADGRVLQRKLGETSFDELSDWASRA